MHPGEKGHIEIYNLTGKVVYQTSVITNNEYKIDLRNEDHGLFLVKCFFDKYTLTKKIIKN